MGIKNIWLSLIVSACLAGNAVAQSESIFDDSTQAGFRAVTSAFIALASDNSLSAGSYKFKTDDAHDSDLDLYKIVGEAAIGNEDDWFVPLVELSPAIINFEQDLSDSEVQAKANVDAWSVGAGVGALMKFMDDTIRVTPRFKLEYSRIDYDFDIVGVDDSLVDQLVPDINALTYLPSLEGAYRLKVSDSGALAILDSRLSFVYVEASSSNSNVDDFSDKSWIWKNRLSYEQPLEVAGQFKDIILRPNFARIEVHGSARDGFGFNNFYEFGLDLMSRKLSPEYLKEFGLGVTYLYEKEVQGWRFGVFGKFA